MAGGDEQDALVVCNLLCFVLYYLSKHPVGLLKTHVCTFYDAKSVSSAKERITLDIYALNVDDTPRMAARRGMADAKLKQEVDDIFNLLAWADKTGLLSKLPRYVSDCPDQLPQFRADRGDISMVLNKMEKWILRWMKFALLWLNSCRPLIVTHVGARI